VGPYSRVSKKTFRSFLMERLNRSIPWPFAGGAVGTSIHTALQAPGILKLICGLPALNAPGCCSLERGALALALEYAHLFVEQLGLGLQLFDGGAVLLALHGLQLHQLSRAGGLALGFFFKAGAE
jgi:hypothetical protein